MSAPAVSAEVEPTYDVDALRLLRFVYLRRVLRGLVGFELLSIPMWTAFSLTMEAVYDRSSTAWQKIDDETGPGFLVIFTALALTLALLVSTRWFGRAGRTAARLAPLTGSGTEPWLGNGADSARALLARLRRKGYVRGWLIALFLLFGSVSVVAVMTFLPAWQGNHGHGGRVITIGKNADIAYSRVVHSSRGGSHRDYFLATPDGTAIAETYHPSAGQRWTVGRDVFGNLRAYKVGGLDYLLMFFLAAVCLLFTVGCVAVQVSGVKEERRLRRSAGDGDLAPDVRALGSGSRATLTIPGRENSKQNEHSVVLGLRPLGKRDPRRLLIRRRVVSSSVAAVIACGLVALLVVQQLGLLNGPPGDRDVTLPYLTPAGWDSDVTVFYGNGGLADVLEDYLGSDSAGRIHQVRDLVINRAKAPAGAADMPSANVAVAQIGSLSPERAVASFHSFRLGDRQIGYAVTDLTGLPAGWAGVYSVPPGKDPLGRVTAMGAVHGTLVEIDIDDFYTTTGEDSASYSEAQLAGWVSSLATALTSYGLTHVEQDTVRPAHG